MTDLELQALLDAASDMDELAAAIDAVNEEKGWNADERSEGDWAALAHSEISEAFECHRNAEPLIWMQDSGKERLAGKPEGAAIEYADAIIRILHWFNRHGISAEEAVRLKVKYNISRPFMHGGKVI